MQFSVASSCNVVAAATICKSYFFFSILYNLGVTYIINPKNYEQLIPIRNLFHLSAGRFKSKKPNICPTTSTQTPDGKPNGLLDVQIYKWPHIKGVQLWAAMPAMGNPVQHSGCRDTLYKWSIASSTQCDCRRPTSNCKSQGDWL